MDVVSIIAEDKIKRAYSDGEFKHLPGKGKPLVLEDLSHIPEHLRMSYKMLKNAGMMQEADELKKEMMTIEQLVASTQNEDEKLKLTNRLNEKMIRFNQLMEKRTVSSNSSAFKQYQQQIHNKLW
ncbi:DUF1992 domain-containing protein [Bacillus sp. SM2101]|uniref:DnaJ family domain-containing protein n=1 Tax=Bacillus sp. SM2101 TaxID=2805366 RepID=UPI001BDE4046|nr:DUF1992 domain-containing protein [Bacillus sp. SM2101]